MSVNIKFTNSQGATQTYSNVDTVTFDTDNGGTAVYHDESYTSDANISSASQLLSGVIAYGTGTARYVGTIPTYNGEYGDVVDIPSAENSTTSSTTKGRLMLNDEHVVTYPYTGQKIIPTLKHLDTTRVNVSGTVEAVEVGTYTLTLSLKRACDYWEDGTKEEKTVDWGISIRYLTVPTAKEMHYSAEAQTVQMYDYDSRFMMLSGEYYATYVGNYTATVSLRDTENTKWIDNSITDKTVNWVMEKLPFNIPTANKSKYTEQPISVSLNGFNSVFMNLSGETQATDIGVYTAVVSLRDTDNTCWSDSSVEEKEINWEILIPTYSIEAKGISNYSFEYDRSLNPNPTVYDGVYVSHNFHQSASVAVAKITFRGYNTFKIYIRSDAEGIFDYTIASVLDADDYPYELNQYAYQHTSGNQQSGTGVIDYTEVIYENDGEEHFIYVTYRKDGSGNAGSDSGYFMIPIEQ